MAETAVVARQLHVVITNSGEGSCRYSMNFSSIFRFVLFTFSINNKKTYTEDEAASPCCISPTASHKLYTYSIRYIVRPHQSWISIRITSVPRFTFHVLVCSLPTVSISINDSCLSAIYTSICMIYIFSPEGKALDFERLPTIASQKRWHVNQHLSSIHSVPAGRVYGPHILGFYVLRAFSYVTKEMIFLLIEYSTANMLNLSQCLTRIAAVD